MEKSIKKEETNNKAAEKNHMRRNDLILLCVILVASALIFVGWKMAHKAPGDVLVIEVDGKISAVYPLSEDGEYKITGVYGRTNTVTIKDGVARMTDSMCPDHLCEMQGKIGKNGETIVCLPNHVIARVEGASDNDVDIQIR